MENFQKYQMDKVIELLKTEVMRNKALSLILTQQGLLERGKYREKEAARLEKILDLLRQVRFWM